MILPVPFKSAQDIVVLNSEDKWADGIMKTIYNYFGKPRTMKSNFLSLTTSRSRLSSSNHLVTQSACSYLFSRANNLDELHNYDRTQFRISSEAYHYISKWYPKGYCFLILTLTHDGEFHPFCYRYPLPHKLQELFIPTRHFHPSKRSNIKIPPKIGPINISSVEQQDQKGDYDHKLYVIGCASNPVLH